MSRTDLDYLIRHAAQLLREVAERCKRARYGFHQYADCMDTATRLEGLLQIREPRLPSAEQRERIVEIFREFNGKEAINQIEFPGCWVCSGDYSVDEVSMALVAVGIDPNYQGSEGDGPDTNLVFKPKAAVASPQPWRTTHRGRVLEMLAAAGPAGLTHEQCDCAGVGKNALPRLIREGLVEQVEGTGTASVPSRYVCAGVKA